jgi:hypothetical protein
MSFLSWCRLRILEQRLYHGAFGKYNRYRRYCIERGATTAKEKLAIATEVLSGPGVSPIEAQDNQLYLRNHKSPKPTIVLSPRAAVPAPIQPKRKKQA